MPIKVVDVDIDRIEGIGGLDGYDDVEILFRSGREPLGRTRIPCNGNFIGPEKIKPYIKNLPEPSPLVVSDAGLPTITVAVCTRNRPKELARTLHALACQTHAPDEVLVIDNGCQDEIRELVHRIIPDARYLKEWRPGLDFARNRAVYAATGSILAFIDDDAEADRFWVQSLVEAFAAFPKAGAVTGLVLPLELKTNAQDLFETYGGFARGFTRRVLPRDGSRRFGFRLPLVADSTAVGTGCNMAFKTALLREIDGFDEALDTGAPLPGGGDMDILYRVVCAGYELVYEPRALVRHWHRPSDRSLNDQLMGHQRGFMAFLVKTFLRERGAPRVGVLLFIVWHQLKKFLRVVRGLAGRSSLPLQLLVSIFVSSIAGFGSYHASRRRIREQTRCLKGKPAAINGQLSELWRYRELIWNLTRRDLKAKYQRSWLGFLWTMMNPLITIGVLIAVFSYVIRLRIDHYWAFLISGYFAWNFFAQTLNGGVQAAVGNAYLTRSAYFPQEVLVVSASLARLAEFIGELLIILSILVIFHHQQVTLSLLMVVPLILILFLLALGISFPLVALAVHFKDTIQIIPLVTMVLFYASPVFYTIDLVPEKIRTFYLLNPIAVLLNLFRSVLYHGKFPQLNQLLGLAVFTVLVALCGYALFNLKKREFAEIV